MSTYVTGAPSDAWIEEREEDPSGRGYYEETGDHDEIELGDENTATDGAWVNTPHGMIYE